MDHYEIASPIKCGSNNFSQSIGSFHFMQECLSTDQIQFGLYLLVLPGRWPLQTTNVSEPVGGLLVGHQMMKVSKSYWEGSLAAPLQRSLREKIVTS